MSMLVVSYMHSGQNEDKSDERCRHIFLVFVNGHKPVKMPQNELQYVLFS